MARFDFEAKGSGTGISVLKFSGVLDKEGTLRDSKIDPMDTLVIDLSTFGAMNSLGVREFISWGTVLRNPKINFVNCPKFFIDQVNNVPNFLPKGSQITSFFVPYYSEQTSEEEMVLFEKGFAFGLDSGKLQIHWPQVKDSQGNYMVADVIEAKYFRFLTKYG